MLANIRGSLLLSSSSWPPTFPMAGRLAAGASAAEEEGAGVSAADADLAGNGASAADVGFAGTGASVPLLLEMVAPKLLAMVVPKKKRETRNVLYVGFMVF